MLKVTNKTQGKYRMPDLEVKTIADVYTLYVMNAGIPHDDFWNQDIIFLETVYFNKMAWNRWEKNPKER